MIIEHFVNSLFHCIRNIFEIITDIFSFKMVILELVSHNAQAESIIKMKKKSV